MARAIRQDGFRACVMDATSEGGRPCDVLARAVDQRMMTQDTDESFAKVEHSLAHEKGVHDPKALAAWIGRKSLGKKIFQARAAAGR